MTLLDISLFFAIHSLAGRGIFGNFLIVFFGEYFIYLVFAIFILAAYRAYKKRKNIAALKPYLGAVVAAFIARYGVTEIIRSFYPHLRPFVTFHLSHLLTDMSYSFPSGHTIVLFSLATATYFFNKKLSYFIYASGLVVGIARIAGGVHYPSDVVGGIIFGIATSGILYLCYSQYRQQYSTKNAL